MSISESSTLLNAALDYAKRGFYVFPLQPRGKRPITPHGFQDAIRDEAIIRAWWGKNPNANIGIRCNGLLVGDFDGYEGTESLNRLQQEHGQLPATWTIRTGGGTEAEPKEQGLQYVYTAPVELNIRPGAGTYGFKKFDVRANDSYICAVPSVTRLPYETLAGSPDNLTEAPQWLIDFIAKSNKLRPTPHATPTEQAQPIPNGQRNATLASLAGTMRRRGMTKEAIVAALKATPCETPLPDSEIESIAASVSRYGPGQPNNSAAKKNTPDDAPLAITALADVQAEEVRWLWYPYLPLAKLILFEGDPGLGKSWVTLAIATAVSLGGRLPNAEIVQQGAVLIASAEDGLADTIKPRLAGMGADTRLIHAILELFTLDEAGFVRLESAIAQVRPILLIIDPLVAYLSAAMDINKANQVRFATARLAALAEKYSMAVLALRHLTKGGALKPLYRGLGSIDLAAACRSVLMAGCDPDNPEKRGIVHIKSNLAPMGKAIGYALRDGGFQWTGESDLTAARILAAEDSEVKTARDEAADFLRNELGDGPVEAAQVWKDAREAGLSEMTLKRAKGSLGVITRRHGETGRRGGGRFTWELPEGTSEVQKDLEYQEYRTGKTDTLNNSSLENDLLQEAGGTLNREAVLGMTVAEAVELWRREGAPVIHLSVCENCTNLEALLSRPGVKPEHLQAVKAWLEQHKGGGR